MQGYLVHYFIVCFNTNAIICMISYVLMGFIAFWNVKYK